MTVARQRRVRAARSRRSAEAERRTRAGEALEIGAPARATAAASPPSSPAASASASRSPARSSTARSVLLLDEPLGALDLKLRQEMQIELKRIQHEVGITFVYVTHDQEEALTMSDRLAVFNQGRIEQVGAPAEVYEQPATRVRRRLRRRLERARARRPPLHGPPGEDPHARRRASRRSGRARRGRARSRRRLRRAGHALLVDARRGRRAARRRPEPRDVARARRSRRGTQVRVGWREEQTFALGPRGTKERGGRK